MAWAGLARLAQLLCRPRVGPLAERLSPQASTPLAAGAAPTVPASPLRLEASGAHDRNPLAARLHPPPLARSAVRRQAPEVGAGWANVHVRICAGGAQQCTFLPRLGGGARQRPLLPGQRQIRPDLDRGPGPCDPESVAQRSTLQNHTHLDRFR